MGTSLEEATWAAVTEAPEHSAPMIALTPAPPKACEVNSSAPFRLAVGLHLESRYAMRSDVSGSKSSAKPSVLLRISRSARYTPPRDEAMRV
eukprot:1066489-Prymnesium_polylepis.2